MNVYTGVVISGSVVFNCGYQVYCIMCVVAHNMLISYCTKGAHLKLNW